MVQYYQGSTASCQPLTTCTTDQFESKPPASNPAADNSGYVSDRQCTALTTCTSETQYESISATTSSDRFCKHLVVCGDRQYELQAPTTTSNRECAPYTLCDLTTQFQSAPGTTMADATCSLLTICTKVQYEAAVPTKTTDRACATLRVCTAAEYQTGIQANGDRKCKVLATCSSSQFESVAPTALSDRGCEDEVVCTDEQTKQGTGKDALCVSSKWVPPITRVQATLTVSVDAPTPKQTTTVRMRVKVLEYAEEAFWGYDDENGTQKHKRGLKDGVPEAYRGPHADGVASTTMLELTPGTHTIHVVDTYEDGWGGGEWQAATLKSNGCILNQLNEVAPAKGGGDSVEIEVPGPDKSPNTEPIIEGFCQATGVDSSKLTVTTISQPQQGQLAIEMEIHVGSPSAAISTTSTISSATAASIEASIVNAGAISGVAVVAKSATFYQRNAQCISGMFLKTGIFISTKEEGLFEEDRKCSNGESACYFCINESSSEGCTIDTGAGPCDQSYCEGLVGWLNIPTPAPTAAPTPALTASPTASPTAAPTPAPTASPTAAPTAPPTATPTPAPTATPTPAPTATPTSAPTPAPTATPTPAPTPAPTSTLTPAPTKAPALAPTQPPCEVCALLVLRDISLGVTWGDDFDDDGEYPDKPPLSETDGWKGLSADTDLKTMAGKLEGITIDGSGLVTEINLRMRALRSIPDFSKNANLKKLFLDTNSLSGPVPDFSKNVALEVVDLRGNYPSRSIPDFSKNVNLKKLYLNVNDLSSEIGDFSKNVNLVDLWLNNNNEKFNTDAEAWKENTANYPGGCRVIVGGWHSVQRAYDWQSRKHS